jgi:solute carrier family 25 phosphate transporter 23/24/25/41
VGLGDVLESEEEREARVRRMFAVLDQRQAGYLDHEQIEAGLAAMSFPGRRKYALELLDVCDSNRDGRIDLSDFRRYVDAKERELYVLFQSIDVSRDGVIEAEEMRIALSSSGIQVGDAELAAFVQHVDQDKNGIITFSEWRDFLWVYPHEVTLANIYQYWEKTYLVDIGEGAVIPEGIGSHHTLRYLVAGAVAGALSRTATAPLDRLKVLLQVQTSGAGVVAGLWHIYKESGFMGFFRGNGINILKVAPESAIKFYSYEIMKRVVVGDGQDGEIGTWGRLFAGGMAGP